MEHMLITLEIKGKQNDITELHEIIKSNMDEDKCFDTLDVCKALLTKRGVKFDTLEFFGFEPNYASDYSKKSKTKLEMTFSDAVETPNSLVAIMTLLGFNVEYSGWGDDNSMIATSEKYEKDKYSIDPCYSSDDDDEDELNEHNKDCDLEDYELTATEYYRWESECNHIFFRNETDLLKCLNGFMNRKINTLEEALELPWVFETEYRDCKEEIIDYAEELNLPIPEKYKDAENEVIMMKFERNLGETFSKLSVEERAKLLGLEMPKLK